MNVAASGQRDVRMKRAKLGFQAALECGFLHALVKLKQMWMPGADTDPDNLWRTFGRKSAQTDDRKKEGFELDRAEFFSQARFDIFRDTLEKAEGEMHLIAIDPTHPANVRIQIDQASAG